MLTVDRNQLRALDRYITGNYGEDQFPEEDYPMTPDELFPVSNDVQQFLATALYQVTKDLAADIAVLEGMEPIAGDEAGKKLNLIIQLIGDAKAEVSNLYGPVATVWKLSGLAVPSMRVSLSGTGLVKSRQLS
jgi:hypothetical protein